MNDKRLIVFILAVSLLVTSSPVLAHHGVAGYDMMKTITLHGTVTKFDWSNPHCVIQLDVKNGNGEVQSWTLELAAPTLMSRAGWTKNSLKQGDEITAEIHPARSGAPVGISATLTFILKILVNGKELPTR